MAGLLQTVDEGTKTIPIPGADKTLQANAVGYDAQTRTVQPEETVSEQLAKILKTGSPVLDKARSDAADYSNSRGLLNSSMGAQAGESAVIGAALPIAQGDANAFGVAAGQNQQATNAGLAQTATAQTTANLSNANAGQDIAKLRETGKIETGLQTLKGTQETALQTLKGSQATMLANIEANYKQLMQASASASSFYTQTSKNITEILNDPNTSAEQKQSAVDKQSTMLQQAMRVFGTMADIDIAGLVGF